MKVFGMNLSLWKKMLVTVCVVGFLGAGSELLAQKVEAKAEAKAAAPAAKKVTRRLPNFYGELVDGTQKEKIYSIQDQYTPQIDALAAQVKALQQKRDAEIEAVLTAEQKVKLEKARAEAKAKAAERAAAKKAAEAKTTPVTAPKSSTTAAPPAK
jgi:capsule polysaccharide export protein KpsE/RkpR